MRRHGARLTAAVVAAGVLLTVAATALAARGVDRDRTADLTLAAREARARIERQVATYTETLLALRSLFATSPDLGRKGFRDFLTLLAPGDRHAGARAVTFDRVVRRADLASFEARVRRDRSVSPAGYPDFRIHPAGTSEEMFVVDYVEPFVGNEMLLGFDVGSTLERRAAVEETRDTGMVVATPPLDLIQGGRGFLLSLGVYDTPELPRTAPARRRHFIGAVAAAFDARETLAAATATSQIQVEIYDIGLTVDPPTAISAAGVVFDQDPRTSFAGPSRPTGLRAELDMNVGSRRWRIFATPGPGFASRVGRFIPIGVGVVGLVLSAVLGLLVHTLLRSKARAEVLAEAMTVDLRQRESDLAEANAQLEEANRALRDFLAVSSHDMRAPLASILGSVDMLRIRGEDLGEDGRRRLIDIAGQATTRLVRLVDDLLTTSQIRAGAVTVRAETLDVRAEIARAIESLAERIGPVEVTGPPARATCDLAHFQRIVTNLVENAFKYGAPPVTIEVGATDGAVEVRVRDAGTGVPADFQPRLFERFARASGPTMAGKAGTGLGLSIVQGLAVANGGTVRYDAPPGGGAAFVVRLPATG